MIFYNRRPRVGLRVVQPPTVEPIELGDAYDHLRIDAYENLPDDALIRGLISAAREWCEDYLGRSVAPQTLELTLQGFPGVRAMGYWGRYAALAYCEDVPHGIELPMGPVLAVLSVVYTDNDGALVTMDTDGFIVDSGADPAIIYPPYGATWPESRIAAGAVRIRYLAGYTLPGDSPQDNQLPWAIVAAMKLMLGHLYENRSAMMALRPGGEEMPLGAKALLDRYRLRTGIA